MLFEESCPSCGGVAILEGTILTCGLCGEQDAPMSVLPVEVRKELEKVTPLSVVELPLSQDFFDYSKKENLETARAVDYVMAFLTGYLGDCDELPSQELPQVRESFELTLEPRVGLLLAEKAQKLNMEAQEILARGLMLYLEEIPGMQVREKPRT